MRDLKIFLVFLCILLWATQARAEDAAPAAGAHKLGAQFFQQMDADHDGKVSEKEYHDFMQKRFETMDANHDGALTQDEMRQAAEQRREKLKELRDARRGTAQ